MLLAALHVSRTLDGLPPGMRELVRERVRVELRRRPTAGDLALGVRSDWRGYFYGHSMRQEEEADELFADDDDGELEPRMPAGGGVIVLFTGNIRGGAAELEEVLLHEIAHFGGDDEDEVSGDGFGDDVDEVSFPCEEGGA